MTDAANKPTIYWISGSAPAWRVLLAMEFKGIDYHSRILETARKEQKSPEFLALSPRGQVPLLQDGAIVVRESLAILHYLEARKPEPALFGETPSQVAAVEQRVHEILAYLDPAVQAFVQPVFRGKPEQVIDRLEDIREDLLILSEADVLAVID